MSRKTVSGIMLIFILISTLTLAFSIQPVKGQPKTWTVDDDGPADFLTIQDALNSPLVVDGDTIFVYNGTYYDHLVVNKAISLLGETRDSSIIDGSETDIVVRVRSDYVTIANLTIRNSRNSYADDSAIHVDGHSHNTIKDNVFTETFVSIYLNNAHNNTICNNEIIAAFQWYTIWLRQSNHNIIEKNLITNNRGSGISLGSSNFNTVNDNSVTGIPTLPTANGQGIVLHAGSHSNVVNNNWLAYNRYSGLSLMESEDNIVQDNILESNYWGIYSWQSSDNSIFHNNFIANSHQAFSELVNVWDDGYPSGGNYWSDYAGNDMYSGPYQNESGYDWIGDAPHYRDNYPLMKPYAPETEEVRITYRKLLGKYNELLADYGKLNSTYYTLSSNYTELQGDYDALNSSYKATKNELSYIKNLLYVFIATTIILVATTVYFAIRKPKIITQTQ